MLNADSRQKRVTKYTLKSRLVLLSSKAREVTTILLACEEVPIVN